MSKNLVKKNFVFQLIYQFFSIVIPIVTMPYVSRVLGASQIGIYSYTLSIVTYFTFFILSIGSYGQREISLNPGNKEYCSKIFYEIMLIKLIFGVISLIVFFAAFCVSAKYKIAYTMQSIYLIGYIIDIAWFYQGKQDFKKTISRSIIFRILGTIAIFVLVNDKSDLAIYILIMSLTVLVSNISLYYYVKDSLVKIGISNIHINRHLKGCIKYFIPCIALEVYTVLDKSMIQWLTNDSAQNGLYEQANKIIKMCLAITTSLSTVKAPHITQLYGENNKTGIRESINVSFKFYAIVSFPMCFGLIATSDSFVPWYLGSGFDEVCILLKIFSFILVFSGLSNIIANQYLIPVKQEIKFTYATIVAAFINVISNAFLIPKYFAIGAALASVFTESIVLIILIYMTHKELDYLYLMKTICKPILSGMIMIVSIFWMKYIPIKGYYITLLQVVTGATVYFIMLLFFREDALLQIVNKLSSKMKKG